MNGVAHASFSRLLRELPGERCGRSRRPLRTELSDCCRSLERRRRCAATPIAPQLLQRHRRRLESPALPLEGIVFDDLHFADDASIELLAVRVGRLQASLVDRGARSRRGVGAGRALLEDDSRPARHRVAWRSSR